MTVKRVINLDYLIKLDKIKTATEKLPDLSSLDKAKLDQSLAIEQLYYSSKLEGTNLTDTMIDKAIHGKISPEATN